MGSATRKAWRKSIQVVGGCMIPWVLPLAVTAADPQPPVFILTRDVQKSAIHSDAPTLRLEDCIHLALEKQPALAAHRASLAAAQAQLRGLNGIHVPPILAGRELPIRRKQACQGVMIAQAGLNQVEWETIYAVKRTYYTVLFTLDQRKVAQDVVANLRVTLDSAKAVFKAGTSRDVTEDTVEQITTYLRLAETRLIHAQQGTERSLAGLREAMGVEHDYPLQLADSQQPTPTIEVTREQAVELALARRGEIVQATGAECIARLEIDAQAATHLLTARTFAAGTDIHARPIPQGISNSEYRPGAIGLEMPTLMAGNRKARIERATDLAARASAVVDKTRHLVALETTDAFLKWQEAAQTLSVAKEAADKAQPLAIKIQASLAGGQNVRAKEVLDALVHGEQSRALYNETLHHYLLGLAALERVTSGGVTTPH